ncbi:MAG: ATP-binding protein [Acidobacteriota bacterium]
MIAFAGDSRPLDVRSSFDRRRAGSMAEVWAPMARRDADLDAWGDGQPHGWDQMRSRGGANHTPEPESHEAGLPVVAKVYVGGIMLFGACMLAMFFPVAVPAPSLSAGLLALVLFSSAFKIELPVAGTSASMSTSFIANFMGVMLVGPSQAMVFAAVGALVQCLMHRRPRTLEAHRILFSMSALVITVQVTGLVYVMLGGHPGFFDLHNLATPMVGAGFAYFVCNAMLVAVAAALATRQSLTRLWFDAFVWSGPSFFVGAGVAVAAAWSIDHSEWWSAMLVTIPAYITYRTYQVYLGRIEEKQRHVDEISALNAKAMQALDLAERSQRALAIEKERVVVTLGSIGEAVIACDTRGRIVLLNRTAESFTGWPQEHAIGLPAADVFRLVDRESGKTYANPVEKVLRQRTTVDRDSRAVLVARDGTQRLIEHSATPVRDDDGVMVAVVLVARDITDAVRLETERERASKLASLGVLAGGLAHDFNNILTAIAGNISLAQLDGGEATRRNNLGEAERACARAKALTHQLLTFAKGGKPVKKTIFIQDLIREAAEFALRGSNVKCAFRLADDLWAVDVDENQIMQVVNNLVINALQAMPDGGVVTVRADNVSPAAGDGEGAKPSVGLSIQDHGIGIPESHLGKIFDPYFTTKSLGSGLGLATAHSIITNHGGAISVHSVLDEGTTMTVLLPAVIGAGRPHRSELPVFEPHHHRRVLIMDDERAVRDVTRAMLGRLGYRVDVADDGQTAIESYRRALGEGDGFELVIMDLTVPGGMGGKEAIKELLAIDPHVVAIVSSGYADDEVMAEYDKYGFRGVVAKPFSLAELARVVGQVEPACAQVSTMDTRQKLSA